MADQNVTQDKFSHEEQKEAFLQAIHASSVEEKGRILQKHPELTNVVDYYDQSVKSHTMSNKGFQGSLGSGDYEAMLAEDVLKGRLSRYDAAVEKLSETQLAVTNKLYGKQSGLLQGFDINMGPNEKPLHIDLQNYSPQGKTPAETKQLREDFSDVYQSTIQRNPEDAERSFKKISQLFPQGISWRAPEQALSEHINTNVLQMQGVPNIGVIASKKYSQAFLRLHDDRANSPLKHGETGLDSFTGITLESMQGAGAAINNGTYFTTEQKEQLNRMMANNINQNGGTITKSLTLDQQQEATI